MIVYPVKAVAQRLTQADAAGDRESETLIEPHRNVAHAL